MSSLRYLCFFAIRGVQHILCCIFVLFFVVLYLFHLLPKGCNVLGIYMYAKLNLWHFNKQCSDMNC
jgi:hypothetical protein